MKKIRNFEEILVDLRRAQRQYGYARLELDCSQDGPVQYERARLRVPVSTCPPIDKWEWVTLRVYLPPYLLVGDMPKYREQNPDVWLVGERV